MKYLERVQPKHPACITALPTQGEGECRHYKHWIKAEASVATCWSHGNPGNTCMMPFPRCLACADEVCVDAVLQRQQLEGAVATGEAQRRKITAKS